jgi:predicted ATPase
MLKSIEIKGYKSIANQKILLENINIIIGANGSGKSNFISFFKMLNHFSTGGLQAFIGKEGSAQSLLYYGYKMTLLLNASLEFLVDGHTDIYSFSLVKAVQNMLIFSEEIEIIDGEKKELGSGYKESILSEERNYKNWVLKKTLNLCHCYQFHDTSIMANIRNVAYIENNKYLYSDGSNLAAYLYMLKNKSDEYWRYYKRIVEKIQYIMPQFDDFSLEPQELNSRYISLNWREKGVNDYLFGPHQISDGSLRFMALTTLLLQPPDRLPNIIVIDEPELGLHPQAIDLLGNMINTAGKYAQIIVATQAPRLVDSFEVENIIVVERDEQNKCSVFKKLDTTDLALWLEDYSLSQLWEKNILGGQP